MKTKLKIKKNEPEKKRLIYSSLKYKKRNKKFKKLKAASKIFYNKFKLLYISSLLSIIAFLTLFIFMKLKIKIFKNSLNKEENDEQNINITELLKINKSEIISKHKYNATNYTQINGVGELLWNNEKINILKIKEEIKSYLNINKSFIQDSYFNKVENPKVSLIITLYNQENFLPTIYTCILMQSLLDIEIIFIDDASTDNTTIVVNEYMERDKRIIYLKNDINRGSFISRNKAILEAKGEYILVVDPDDLIINNILMKAYKTAKQYDLDIVQFYIFVGTFERPIIWRQTRFRPGILRNSDVKKIFYYSISRNLIDKLVKREVYLKSIEFMDEKYRNERFYANDDDVAFFGLINIAQSYGFLEQAGYFYSYTNPKSRMNFLHSKEYIDRTFRALFTIMKYYYEKSGNNSFEKNKVAFEFFDKKVYGAFFKDINKVTQDFDFYNEILDLYLNCTFYNNTQKSKLLAFKSKLNNRSSI